MRRRIDVEDRRRDVEGHPCPEAIEGRPPDRRPPAPPAAAARPPRPEPRRRPTQAPPTPPRARRRPAATPSGGARSRGEASRCEESAAAAPEAEPARAAP